MGGGGGGGGAVVAVWVVVRKPHRTHTARVTSNLMPDGQIPQHRAVVGIEPTTSRTHSDNHSNQTANGTPAWARQPRNASKQNTTGRAVLGIEPRTSRTQSENHTTRPNSQWNFGIIVCPNWIIAVWIRSGCPQLTFPHACHPILSTKMVRLQFSILLTAPRRN